MAEFEVGLPGGSTYAVAVPDGVVPAQEDLLRQVFRQMTPEDKLAVQNSKGITNVYYQRWVQESRRGETPEARQQRLVGGLSEPEPIGAVEGVTRAGTQGILAGAGDEVTAAIGTAIVDPLLNRYPGIPASDRFNTRLGAERGKLEQFREERPVLAAGAEIAGAIPTALVPGMAGQRALQGASPLVRGLIGGAQGAAEGAVFGFNAGEGGFGPRARNAARTAAFSAPLATAAPLAGAGARNAFNRTAQRTAGRPFGLRGAAFETVSEITEADNFTGQGERRLAEIGADARPADAGRSSAALLDFVGQRPGPSAQFVDEELSRRTTTAANRINATLDNVFGKPQGVRATAREIGRSTAAARREAYEVPYAQIIDYDDEIGGEIIETLDRIPRRVLRDAVEEANEEMQAQGIRNQQIIIDVAEDGTEQLVELPNVRQLDEIKRALGRIGNDEVGTFGRPNRKGIRARGLASDLRSALSGVEGYDEAVRLGGDKIQRENALELGYDLLRGRTTRETVAEGVERFGDNEEARTALRTGIRSQIDDTLANVKTAFTDPNLEAREAAKGLKDFSSRASREKLTMALGERDAARLLGELDRATAAFQLHARVADNSKTAVRQFMEDRFSGANRAGIIRRAARADVPGAIGETVGSLSGNSSAQLRKLDDSAALEIAQALINPRGVDAGNFLTGVRAARQSIGPRGENVRALSEALMRATPGVTAPTAQNIR